MKLKIISGSSHKEFTKTICSHLNIKETTITSRVFSNENRFVSIDEPVRDHDVFVIQTQISPVDAHIMELLIIIRALRDASAGRITAVMPYLPYARSDKKNQPRICVVARLLADMLESAGANHALIMDMHSPQIQGFFSMPCDQLLAAPEIIKYLKENWDMSNYCLVAGDAGAAKMLKSYADGLGLPVAIMDKRREKNDEDVTIKGVIGDVKNKKALIIDDETQTGGTLIRDTEFLLGSAGAISVDACIVHPALGSDAAKRLNNSPIEKFITTDTIPINQFDWKNVEVVSVTKKFAECIQRMHNGESIKSLND